MKLAARILSVFSLLALSVEGKKEKRTYKYNSQSVDTKGFWLTEGCRDWNAIHVSTRDGASKDPFGVSDAPPEIHVFGDYYRNCESLQATRTRFSYDAQFEFSGVHNVYDVQNATVAFDLEGVDVSISDCTFDERYSEYNCDTSEYLSLPLSFTHSVTTTSGGSYKYRDKTVSITPRFVMKANTVNICRDAESVTFEVTLGDEQWNSENVFIPAGQLCKYKSGFIEIYTVS